MRPGPPHEIATHYNSRALAEVLVSRLEMPVVEVKPDVVPQEEHTPTKDTLKPELPLPKNVKLIPVTNQTRELQTIIREK